MLAAPPPFPTPTQAHLDEAVRRIVAAVDPERIIVFGSFARGEARPGSDLDLLVVLKFEGSHHRKMGEVGALLSGLDVPKDVLVVTPADVERSMDRWDSVIKTACVEGITVYARTP